MGPSWPLCTVSRRLVAVYIIACLRKENLIGDVNMSGFDFKNSSLLNPEQLENNPDLASVINQREKGDGYLKGVYELIDDCDDIERRNIIALLPYISTSYSQCIYDYVTADFNSSVKGADANECKKFVRAFFKKRSNREQAFLASAIELVVIQYRAGMRFAYVQFPDKNIHPQIFMFSASMMLQNQQ